MARQIADLNAEVRTGTGKGAARQACREGYVPGIIYGGGTDPQPINIQYNALLKRLKAAELYRKKKTFGGKPLRTGGKKRKK